jgi:hypothetical protein
MRAKTTVEADDLCPCGSGAKYGRCCLRRGPDAYGNRIQHQTVPVLLEGARTEILSSFIGGDKRFRIIWNRLYWFPQEQTFHEFLDYLIMHTLGRAWFKAQREKPSLGCHVVCRWRTTLLNLVEKPPDKADGGHVMTGPVTSYLCFGYDLYWLQLLHRLPKSLIKRLRSNEHFQGARYEVAIAAACARAGFEIELLDESMKSVKHCEFVAVHKRTKTKVYVEVKSRRRPGVMNQTGIFDPSAHIKGDIFGLYSDAIQQAPADCAPYLIFIDTNLPSDVPKGTTAYGPIPIDTYPWMREIRDGLNSRWSECKGATVETAVCITNYGSHFGDENAAAPIGACALFASPKPRAPIVDPRMVADLAYCLRHYTTIPKQF